METTETRKSLYPCAHIVPAPERRHSEAPGGGMWEEHEHTHYNTHTHTPWKSPTRGNPHHVTQESKTITKGQNKRPNSIHRKDGLRHFHKHRGTQRSTVMILGKTRRVHILCGSWQTSLRKPSQPELCKWPSLCPPWKRSSSQDMQWEERESTNPDLIKCGLTGSIPAAQGAK